MNGYRVHPLAVSDVPKALSLARAVFMECQAPEYSGEGVAEFFHYTEPQDVIRRMAATEFFSWGCRIGNTLVGILALEPADHISLLFVDKAYHRRGVARSLFETALASQTCANVTTMTVNSSPFAVPVYSRFGFTATDVEQCLNGIRFTPMTLRIA